MSKRLAFCAGLFLLTPFGPVAFAADGQALQIVVSKDQQLLNVYDGDEIIATSNVSTGKAGHTTPSGIFSVLEKQKFHKSNLYSESPMPWMQRITWSGIALHESTHVPKHPASHGCIRLPAAFARELFKLTRTGARVVVTNELMSPQEITGQSLFKPKLSPESPYFLSDISMRPSLATDTKAEVEVAMNDPRAARIPAVIAEQEPISILITRADAAAKLREVQSALNQLGYDAGLEDGVAGANTNYAITQFKTDNSLKPDSANIDEAFIASLFEKANRPPPQNGQLIIRQNFNEIYRAAVTIENPGLSLGTHFMLARDTDPKTQMVRWYAMSLDNHIPAAAKKRLGIESETETTTPDSALSAFDRIKIPDDVRAKVEDMLADGSSVTITDVENKTETGPGTNFVTILH
jgi:peptidoglycan hydrolase-like protein with peptidoglycan-binding domain